MADSFQESRGDKSATSQFDSILFLSRFFCSSFSLLEVCDWVVAWPPSPLRDAKGRNPSVHHLSNVDVQKASNVHRLLVTFEKKPWAVEP